MQATLPPLPSDEDGKQEYDNNDEDTLKWSATASFIRRLQHKSSMQLLLSFQ